MSDVIQIPSADVLMNRGVIVKVHNVIKDDTTGKWSRVRDAEGNYTFTNMPFKFTNWTLTLFDLPEPLGFGGMENWQEQFSSNGAMLKTLLHTVALLEDKTTLRSGDFSDIPEVEGPDIQYAAMRLVDSNPQYYTIAMTGALMLSQGITAEKLVPVLRKQIKDVQDGMNEMAEEMLKDDEKVTSPQGESAESVTPINPPSSPSSSVPSPDGVLLDEVTTSFGN